MTKYVIKRILAVIPMLLAVVLVVFITLNITPSNPGEMILGKDAEPEEIEKLNKEFGMDKPVIVRYFDYIKNACKGDFGRSYRTNLPVFEMIFAKFPITVKITLISMISSLVVGVPIGILCAVKQYSKFDMFTTSFSLIIATIPSFVTGIVLLLIFSLKLGWLPSSGIGTWKHYIIPIATGLVGGSAGQLRMSRAYMLQTLKQDYIRTAKAKGASQSRIIIFHAIRNAFLPLVTSLGMSFSLGLGGSIITETLFGIPGVGSVILTAVSMKDIPLIIASTLLLSSIYCFMMIFVDVINTIIDPRLKARYVK